MSDVGDIRAEINALAKVIDLQEHRLGRAHGWAVFRIICRACGHRWVGVKVNCPPYDTFGCSKCSEARGEAVPEAEWNQ